MSLSIARTMSQVIVRASKQFCLNFANKTWSNPWYDFHEFTRGRKKNMKESC